MTTAGFESAVCRVFALRADRVDWTTAVQCRRTIVLGFHLPRNDMDKIDHRILTALEDDGRQSFADLGEQVGLSKTPCWQRVRELERDGVIRGYRADIDPSRLGLHVEAFVQVTLSSVQHAQFEAAVLRHPSILQCFTTAGQADYLMHVLVAGIDELDRLLRMEISQLPGVRKIETTVCMKTIKHRAPITGCLIGAR